MKNVLSVLVTLLLVHLLPAQVTNDGQPDSWSWTDSTLPELVYIAPPDVAKLLREDAQVDGDNPKPWRFGSESLVDHNLHNSGVWKTLSNGDRVWRIRYHSPGAKTLNFLFSDFFMPAGASVYLYNSNRSDLLGAYTSSQNNKENVLGTWLVNGDDIVIEYFEPASVTGLGRLEVFKVVHGYRTIAFQDDVNNGDECMYDAECFVNGVNNLKDISKNSVAMLLVNSTGFCSGALINNTSNDGTPYLLTANHCYSDPSEWAILFKWKSAEPVCGVIKESQTPVNFRLTTSGATLKARHGLTDFALVELVSDIPSSWGLVWSGWDRSQTIPPLVYGLHHPRGAAMKVSVDYNAPAMEAGGLDDGLVWTIFGWETGALQPGSSGSALFDNNGRIRGQAWYIFGNPSCNGAVPGGQSSGYGRLNVAWNAGPTSQTRLREWLDPGNTGLMTTNVYPSQQLPQLRADIDFHETTPFSCRTETTPEIRLVNKGSQIISSAQLSYVYNEGVPVTLNWTGTLPVNSSVVVPLPEITSGEQTMVNVSLQQINNVVLSPFETIQISSLIDPDPLVETGIILNLQTDGFAEETSWDLYDQTGFKIDWVPSSFYFNNQSYTHQMPLLPGCYTFVIKDDFGDGLGQGSYNITSMSGATLTAGSNFGAKEITRFQVGPALATESRQDVSAKVYPNPTTGSFKIELPELTPGTLFSCYSVTGQLVASGTISNHITAVDLSAAAAGLYMLKISDGSGHQSNYKIMLQ